MGANSLGDHFRVHTFAPLWLMCDRFGNTCSQRNKLKCGIDLGSQNNKNKFWLRIKLIKLNQGLKLIDTTLLWSKSKWDRGEITYW